MLCHQILGTSNSENAKTIPEGNKTPGERGTSDDETAKENARRGTERTKKT